MHVYRTVQYGPMGSNTVPWGPIRSHGVPCGPMGSHGFPYGPIRPHGVPCGIFGNSHSGNFRKLSNFWKFTFRQDPAGSG